MTTTIFINGQRMDLGKDPNISLTFRSSAFVAVDKINNSYSNTITLPRTANNEAVFGGVVLPSSASAIPYAYLPASIEIDGVMVVSSAVAYITEVTEKEYKVAIVWDSAIKLAKIISEEKQLNELDFDPSNNADFVVWDDANATKYPSRFPSADYGFVKSDGTKSDNVNNHPAVSVVEVLERICNQYDIIPPPAEDLVKMSKWRIPLVSRIDPVITKSKYGHLNNFVDWYDSFFYIENDFSWQSRFLLSRKYAYNGENGLPKGGDLISRKFYGSERVDNDDYVVAFIPFYDKCKITLSGEFKIQLNASSPYTKAQLLNTKFALYATYVSKEGQTTQKNILEVEPYDAVPSVSGTQGYIHFKFDDVESESLPLLRQYVEPSLPDAKYAIIVPRIIHYLDGALKEGTSYAGFLHLEQHAEEVQYGEDYFIVPNLPEIKIVDFLKTLATMSGQFITIEGDQLRFLDYAQYEQRKTNAYDWSNYATSAMQVSYTLGEWAKKNIFAFKENEGRTNRNTFTIKNDALKDKYEVNVPFLAGEEKNFLLHVPLYEYEEGETEPTYNSSSEAYIAEVSNDGKRLVRALSFTQLMNNYDYLKGILQEVKVVKTQLRLPMPELANIDIHHPIYLKQFGAYFAIIELKTRTNGIVDAELLKI